MKRVYNGQNSKNFSNKISKVILDYKPEYKINVHEYIQMIELSK